MTLQTLAAIATLITFGILMVQLFYGFWRKVQWSEYLKRFRLWFSCLLLVVLVGVDIRIRVNLPSPEDTSTYGFETGSMNWMARTSGDVQGLTVVGQSKDQAKLGKYSLKIDANLEAGSSDHAKGEVSVGIPKRNLDGKQISVSVFFPDAAICGPSNAPSGFQIFVKSKVPVKDADGKIQDAWGHYYGKWNSIEPFMVRQWAEFVMTPSTEPPIEDEMSPDFDPTSVVEIGVKIGLNDKDTSTKYEGSILIDAVTLPE